MKIAIRTDCGVDAGLGHLRRCLSLAQALVKLDADVRFFLHGEQAGLAMIRRAGFDAEADAGPGQMVKTLHGWGCTAVVTDSYSLESDYWSIGGINQAQ